MSGLGLSVRRMRQPISPHVGDFVMLDGPRHEARKAESVLRSPTKRSLGQKLRTGHLPIESGSPCTF